MTGNVSLVPKVTIVLKEPLLLQFVQQECTLMSKHSMNVKSAQVDISLTKVQNTVLQIHLVFTPQTQVCLLVKQVLTVIGVTLPALLAKMAFCVQKLGR